MIKSKYSGLIIGLNQELEVFLINIIQNFSNSMKYKTIF